MPRMTPAQKAILAMLPTDGSVAAIPMALQAARVANPAEVPIFVALAHARIMQLLNNHQE